MVDSDSEKFKKVPVRVKDSKKPVSDVMSLMGTLSKKAIKGQRIDQIIKKEEAAVAQAVAEKYRLTSNFKYS